MVGLGHLFRIHSVDLILGYEYVESRVIFIIIIIMSQYETLECCPHYE